MPNKPPPDYESVELKQWRENADAVPEELESKSERLLTRIMAFVAKFGFKEPEVSEKVKSDVMFAAHFAKEPRRQGLHEIMAADWIKSIPGVDGFRVLPKSGSKAFYVTSDGDIDKGIRGSRPGKSLDFFWKTKGIDCYAMHKYTKEGGGNQDSQFKEMVALLGNFLKCQDTSCVLFVIADGQYYPGKKMDQLRKYTRDRAPRSYALPIEELPNILETL